MLTLQEILEKNAEDYRLFSNYDVYELSIFSVSLSLNPVAADQPDSPFQEPEENFLRGHAEISEASKFLKSRKHNESSRYSEVLLLTTRSMDECLLNRLKEFKSQMADQTIVLLQTKLSEEDLYLRLLIRISEENRQTKALISNDYFLLTDLLIKDASIREIEKAARDILGNPMIITDDSYKVLAYSQGIDITDPIWSIIVSNTYCPSNLVKLTDYNQFWKRLKSSRRPLFVDSDHFSPYIRRAVAEIRSNGKTKGYIALLEKNKTITGRDLFVLQMVADLIGIRLKQMDDILKAKGQMEREFLNDLFQGTMKSEKMAVNRAQSLGWKICGHYLAMCVSNNRTNTSTSNKVFLKLQQALLTRFPLCVFSSNSGMACFVLGSDGAGKLQLSSFVELEKFLKKENLVCYAGLPCQTLTGIPDSYSQAINSFKVMEMFGEAYDNKSVYSYSETAVFLFLSRLSPTKEEQTTLISGALRKLLETDKTEGTEYVPTLRHFFLNNQNVAATADSMYLHRNTINYRLQKIKELLDEDFDHPAVRLHFQLSLILFDMGLLD